MKKELQNGPIFIEFSIRFMATGCKIRIGKIAYWIVMAAILLWRAIVAFQNGL